MGIRRDRERGKVGTPAAAFGLAVHGRLTLRAIGLHGESMRRRAQLVENLFGFEMNE